MARQLYYALRRRDNGKWLTGDFSYRLIREANEPQPLKRLSTARAHRLRALLSQPGLLGNIEIREIIITVETKDQIEENQAIIERLLGLLMATRGNKENAHIPEYVEFAEHLMQICLENVAMRYLAVFLGDEGSRRLPVVLHAETNMKAIATYVRKGGVFLVKSDTDLAMLKLHDGFVPDIIYDFETNTLLNG